MKSVEIGAFEAKTRLSELLAQVEQGTQYVITKRGRPVAALTPVRPREGVRFGCDRGRVQVADNFEAPVPELEQVLVTVIVDTHAFLWFVTGDRRLSRRARQTLERAPEH